MATAVSVAVMIARGHALTPQGLFTIYAIASAVRKAALDDFSICVKKFAETVVTLARFQRILEVAKKHGSLTQEADHLEAEGSLAREGKEFSDFNKKSTHRTLRWE